MDGDFHRPGNRVRLRFGVGRLLVAMTALALVGATLIGMPRWLAEQVYRCVLVGAAAALIGAAVVSRPERRAFCLASLFAVIVWRVNPPNFRALHAIGLYGIGWSLLFELLLLGVVAAGGGYLSAATARWLIAKEGNAEEPGSHSNVAEDENS